MKEYWELAERQLTGDTRYIWSPPWPAVVRGLGASVLIRAAPMKRPSAQAGAEFARELGLSDQQALDLRRLIEQARKEGREEARQDGRRER